MGSKLLLRLFIIEFVILPIFLSGGELLDSRSCAEVSAKKKDSSKILREIYREVKELGRFPGDDFIKREFFVGKDDDDTYQDIHVLILIQNMDDGERMTIQVTYLQPSKNNPTVKYAESMRSIVCSLDEGSTDIIKSDLDEKEHKKFLSQVLHAIRGKKKLLKKIRCLTPP